ncbi:uncharacterized protein Z519_01537 [Cladophialophora bantiana CBS 173.52]|uniref:Uncharacterized protein n=1 Tax=Cladophialophora bantiana (strain ATCC 10958 / CBS 173.52 / CDC B-1940 / NIH 8579) TaxID=1442370 RepID=A0A0D2HX42_CLAB1|nr:uncharacterized protein Z519_01537 [Cladophialophora bantiana CBS 173.52]KIW97953.1 hypothetical protein Z519_01537 [Cladophialophora bantiana CBS 173.52]
MPSFNFTIPDIPTLLEPYRENLPPAVQAYLTRTNLQALLRVIVAISTYALFRPHLESLFRKMTGTPVRREEEARARLEFLRRQQQEGSGVAAGAGGGAGKANKSVGIVGKDGKIYQVVPPQVGQQQQQQQHGGGKNRSGSRKKDARKKV